MRLSKQATIVASLALFLALDGRASAATDVIPIYVSTTSPHTISAGTAGPWSFKILCQPDYARIKISGRAVSLVGGTTSRSVNDGDGHTFVSTLEYMGAGWVATADTNEEVKLTVFLKDGPTMAQMELLLTADDSTPKKCHAIGTVTLITP